MKKAVIAIDSFKGSLTSAEAAEAVEKAILKNYPQCKVYKIPVADGGEGTINSINSVLKTKRIHIQTVDPLFRNIKAEYIVTERGEAIIELAAASGITILKERELNPMKTSTYGTGILVADALDKGFRNIILTLGGSATNDAGTGILKALGIKFTDKENHEVECNGKTLEEIHNIDISNMMNAAKEATFTLACDVTNPLYGPDGAAFVFARQKGADKQMIEFLDKGLQNIGKLYNRFAGKDIANIPGAGAAGGTAAGLIAILNAKVISGAEFILEITGFEKVTEGADMIITGEGKIDSQTLDGKLPAIVARYAEKKGIPVVAVCGRYTANSEERTSMPFEIIEATPHDMLLHEAMKPQTASRLVYESMLGYFKDISGKDRKHR